MADRAHTKSHRGRRLVPGPDPRVDTLLGMVMALTSEVSVLRERLDAHESLAASGKVADQEGVDQYQPTAADESRRKQHRDRLIDKVCRPLIASAQQDS